MFVTREVLATVVAPLSIEVTEERTGIEKEEIGNIGTQLKTKTRVSVSIESPAPCHRPTTILHKGIAQISTCKWLHHRALLL